MNFPTNFTDWFRAFLSTVSGHPILERLFFASVEFAAIVALVWFFIRVARIKSARLMSLLWLVALAKPIVSLVLGSPLPLLKLEVAKSDVVKTAEAAIDEQLFAIQNSLPAHAIEDVSVSTGEPSRRDFSETDFSFMRNPDEGRYARSVPPAEFASLPAAAPVETSTLPTVAETPALPTPSRWNAVTIVISLWLAGVALFVFRSVLDRVRLRRLIRRAASPEATLSARYAQLAAAFCIRHAPRLRVADELESPALVGSLVPTVLIPRWLVSERDGDKIDWALRHELMHWKLFDTHAGLVREVAQALFYFHPAVWWAGRQWEVTAELACDRAIITDDAQSHDYAAQLYGMLVEIRDRRRFPVKSGLFATRTQITQRIAALVHSPCRTRAHLGAFALVAVAAVSLAALTIGGTFADKEPAADLTIASDESSVSETPAVDPAAKAEPDKPQDGAPALVHGRVVDAQGMPVPDAKLYGPRAVQNRTTSAQDEIELQLIGETDASGRFAVPLPDKNTVAPYVEKCLVAYCAGMAVNWIDNAENDRDKPPEIVLQAEQIIRGRLIDTEGRPVAKAKIVVDDLLVPIPGRSLDQYLAARRNEPHEASQKNLRNPEIGLQPLLKTESDANGRFELRGGAAESIYSIVITADSVAWSSLRVVNRIGFIPQPELDANSKQSPLVMPILAGPDFTHVCEPEFTIEGLVTTADDRPVERVAIDAYTLDKIGAFTTGYGRTVSDAAGRYRLTGLSRGARIAVGFAPDETSSLLPRSESVESHSPEGRTTLNVTLKRGILVTGQIVDAATGNAICGNVDSMPLPNNEHVKNGEFDGHSQNTRATHADGTFCVTVVPGPSVIKVQATSGSVRIGDQQLRPYCEPFLTADELRSTGLGKYDLKQYAAARVVDYAQDGGPQKLNLEIRRGKTVDVSFVDAKGVPVENVFISGITELWPMTAQLTEPRCTVYALSTERPRKLLVLESQRHLAGSVTLTGDEKSPVTVALAPTATIRGRAVTAAGLPIGNATVKLRFDREIAGELYRFHPLHSSEISTDKEGRFEDRNMVPDEPFQFEMELDQEYLGSQPAKKRTTLSSGQQLDLGDIVFAPPRPDVATKQPDDANPDSAAMPGQTKSGTSIARGTNAADGTEPATGRAAEIEFGGTVTDADGKRVAGAEIWFALPPDDSNHPAARGIVRRLALSDQQGQFAFRLEPIKAARPDAVNWTHSVRVTAKAPGYGCEWLPLAAFEKNPVPSETRDEFAQRIDKRLGAGRFAGRTLKLPPEAGPVQGRLVDLEGHPLAGVAVCVENVQNSDFELLTQAFEKSNRDLANQAANVREAPGGWITRHEWQVLVPPVKTNENGEFSLSGLGRDQMATVTFLGERVAAERLFILGREIETKRLPHISSIPDGAKDTFVGTRFTHAVGPAIPISGQVTEFKSGKPIARATVFVERLFRRESMNFAGQLRLFTRHISAVTDEQGRYRLVGIPPGEGHVLNVIAPKSEPWLIASQEISLASNAATAIVNVQVFRGIWIEGRVTDATTGEPISGRVDYLALQKNPNIPQKFGLHDGWQTGRFPIGEAGHYRVAGLPGPGVLLVWSSGKTIYPRSVGAEKIDGYNPKNNFLPTTPSGMPLSNWNRIQEINPPVDAESFTIDLTLSAGTSLFGRVVLPSGAPASRVEALGQIERNPFFSELKDDKFTISNYEPAVARNLFFKAADNSLVAHLHLEGNPPADLSVTLRPAVTVRGRLIETETDDEAVGYLLYCESTKHGKFRIDDTTTDENGRFEVKGLLAGNIYKMDSANPKRFSSQKNGFTIDLTNAKPGDVIELGDVTGKKAKSAPQSEPAKPVDKAPGDPPVDRPVNGGKNGTPSAAAEKKETPSTSTAKPKSPSPSAGRAVEVPAADKAKSDALSIRGRVLGPDGKPAAKAYVAVIGSKIQPERGGDLSSRSAVLAEAVTDDSGRFIISLSGVSSKMHSQSHVIARSDGSGLAWRRIDPDARDVDVPFDLPAQQVIRGRFIDIEGQPAGTVKMSINSISPRTVPARPGERLGHYEFTRPPQAWPPAVTANQNGNFTIRGIPADHGIHLGVEGNDRFAPQGVTLNTGAPEQRPDSDATYRSLVRNVKPGDEVVLPLAPAQIFEGVVRFDDTGEAAANARLTIFSSQQEGGGSWYGLAGNADAQGRYRINPHPGVRFGITAYPPDGVPYLIRKTRDLTHKDGAPVKQVDVTLPRGVLVRGRVVESRTKTPIAGAMIQYVPESRNNRRATEDIITGWEGIQLSGESGVFEIAVLPGPGALLVNGPAGQFVLQEFGSRHLDRGTPGGDRNYAHAMQRINPELDADPLDVTIELRRGATVSCRLTNAAHEPIEHALVISRVFVNPAELRWRGFPKEALGGRFELSGLGHGVEYPVHFLDAKDRLGATALFKAGDDSPTVVLVPCGEAVATFVDKNDKPLAGFNPGFEMVVTPGPHRFAMQPTADRELAADGALVVNIDRRNYAKVPQIDAEGRITYPALIPGARYRIIDFVKGRAVVLKEFVAESRKTVDLGKITVEAPKEE